MKLYFEQAQQRENRQLAGIVEAVAVGYRGGKDAAEYIKALRGDQR